MRLFPALVRAFALGVTMAVIGSCTTGVPPDAMAMTPETLANRRLQTRRFDTTDEMKILSAAVALVQDLGFNIDATQSKLGLVAGSKRRDATETAQFVLSSIFGSSEADRDQTIRVSVVTHPSGSQIVVRVTFQRIVRTTSGYVSRQEFIDDAEIYRRFFEKMSKSVFLEAQQI